MSATAPIEELRTQAPVHGTRGLVAASPLFNAGLGFLTTAVLARVLSFDLLGLYVNWTYAASILAIIAGLGLPSANALFAARHPEAIASINGNSLAAILLSGLVGALALYAYVGGSFSENHLGAGLLLLFSAIVPLSALVSGINGALLGNRKNLLFALLASAQVVTQFFGVVLILLLGLSPERSLGLALTFHGVGFVIAFATALFAIGPVAPPSCSLLTRTLRFGLPLWAHSILTVLVQRADILILSFLLSAREVGIYALATKLADSLSYIPQGLGLALFADFADSTADRAARLAGAGTRLVLALNTVLGFACYYGAAHLLPYVIPKVSATIALLPALLAAVVAAGSAYILLSCCQARGQSRATLSVTLLSFVSRSCLLPLLVVVGGLAAAPTAVLASSVLMFLYALHQTARSTRVRLVDLVVPLRSDRQFAAAFVTEILKNR